MGVPLTLLLGGDVMTGRGIDQVLAHPGDPLLHEEFVHDARDYVRLAEQVNGAIPRGVDAACVWGDALDQLRRADLSGATARRLADDLARQRRRGDLALLSIHWGGNWGLDVPEVHRRFAHALIDAGAVDLVHGHSSHHLLPLEVHRGRLIVHGCGDLLNDYEGIAPRGLLRSDVGCLYRATLADDGALQAVQIVPMRMRRFRLEKADEAATRWVAGVLDAGRARFGTSVERAGDGSLSLRWPSQGASATRA